MMEWEEDGEVQDLDLTLPGRQALGVIAEHLFTLFTFVSQSYFPERTD